MSTHGAQAPDIDYKKDIDESLWPSPSATEHGPVLPLRSHRASSRDGRGEQSGTREDGLRRELLGVRKVNEAIEDAIEGLAKAKDNLKTVNTTVAAASSLLSTWTKILSQTEHNKRLVLNPAWQGASQDIANTQRQQQQQQQQQQYQQQREAIIRKEAERREYEEQERRNATTAETSTIVAKNKSGTRTVTSKVPRGATASSRGRTDSGLRGRRGNVRGVGVTPAAVSGGGDSGSAGGTQSMGRFRAASERGSVSGRYTASEGGGISSRGGAGSARGRGRGVR